MLGVYGTGTTETPQTEGIFQGLSNFLAAGGSIDEFMVRTFPQTAGVKMKQFGALPKGLSKAAVRGGASKVGGMLSRRVPLAGGLLQAATGDPIGGAGTALGGTIGASIGTAIMPGVGTVLGGLIGGGIGQSATRGLAGIDISDPYSGPDYSLFGIPMTPYAKEKMKKERARKELGKDMAAMEPFIQKQMGREMAAQQQVITGNLMNTALANARFGR
tara:strand:+ start:1063 stop:1713 length:651 start_codon:yes stop_codon:yes gene_type:complete